MFWLRNKKNILHLSGALSECSHVVLYIEHDCYKCTLICLSNNTGHVVKLFISLKNLILKFAHRSFFYILCIHMLFSPFPKKVPQTPYNLLICKSIIGHYRCNLCGPATAGEIPSSEQEALYGLRGPRESI